MIIELILEKLTKVKEKGILKSKLIHELSMKTATGEKYLSQLILAGYITVDETKWGNDRVKNVVKITDKGLQRYKWFICLSSELNLME